MGITISLASAQELDSTDPLSEYRSQFHIADPDLIYMDGNSLGRLTIASEQHIRDVIEEEWGRELVRSWNTGWWQAPGRVGDKIGRLIGAGNGQVIVTDSTSVNLFKLVTAALHMQPARKTILSDTLNFPTDLYIFQGCAHLLNRGHVLKLIHSRDGIRIDLPDIISRLNEDTAVLSLSHVVFKSGYLYDMKAVTQAAHQAGALVVWDLSHSVGAVPIELDRWNVDLAVGCTYKYLNGGPGSPAFLYVRKDLQDKLVSPIWGWFGQYSPFSFDLDYTPTNGIARFLAGSPPILSIASLEAAIDLPLRAGIREIRRKSEALTSFAIELFDQFLASCGFSLGTPRSPSERGSHISFRHPEAYRINQALIEEMKVIPDFREPDNLRLGFAPLYTSFEEVWRAIDRIRCIVEDDLYLKYSLERKLVT